MDELRFDGEGGIVAGTGRAGTFVAAGHGCSVIVNDFGSLCGYGAFNVPRATVASEPRAGVGTVVASMETMRQQSADVIVDLALATFGGCAAWSTTQASPATGLSHSSPPAVEHQLDAHRSDIPRLRAAPSLRSACRCRRSGRPSRAGAPASRESPRLIWRSRGHLRR
jgi:hypothetical protein